MRRPLRKSQVYPSWDPNKKQEIPISFFDMKTVPVVEPHSLASKILAQWCRTRQKNKQVVLLSSMHDDDDAIDNDEDSPTYGKPEIVLFYNSSKGGVDTVDHFLFSPKHCRCK